MDIFVKNKDTKGISTVLIVGFMAGLAIGATMGFLFVNNYIHNYTEKAVESYNLCVQELDKCNPVAHYNITGGFEYDNDDRFRNVK